MQGVVDLAPDQSAQFLPQIDGSYQQLPEFVLGRITRQVVEQVGDVGADLLVRGEQAEIGIEARGERIVVAGAQMDVAADGVAFPAHHQRNLSNGPSAPADRRRHARPRLPGLEPTRCCSPRRSGLSAPPSPRPACRSRWRSPELRRSASCGPRDRA